MCVLQYEKIKYLVDKIKLIETKCEDNNCIKGASYDLHVGNVIAYKGERYNIKEAGELTIGKHEIAYIESEETLNIPQYMVARYDLRMEFQRKGLMLQAGLHMDPGYSGKVFSLLFNLSNEPVTLGYQKPFASMEFSYLAKREEADEESRKTDQVYKQPLYTLETIKRSGMGQLLSDTENTKKQTETTLKIIEELRTRQERHVERVDESVSRLDQRLTERINWMSGISFALMGMFITAIAVLIAMKGSGIFEVVTIPPLPKDAVITQVITIKQTWWLMGMILGALSIIVVAPIAAIIIPIREMFERRWRQKDKLANNKDQNTQKEKDHIEKV